MRKTCCAVVSILAVFFTLSCSHKSLKPLDKEGYLKLQYEHMPVSDSLIYPKIFWDNATEKTLQVRERMAWGIPEKEFRHFVLPLRVNNEDLDNFRIQYADEICDRVSGMTLDEAILEINHWCHEKVTYMPTDARTRGPIALMATGKGRCGEESTFTVSALRAAGIPARQVYTPRWAHTDDNHAWVEAWVDGKWHFLGACEPEPKLDMGWFNAPVSRALLLHTRVSGDYHGDEDVITKNQVFTEINVIRGYVPARKSVVTVLHEDGTPASGISVEFKIFNYQEFCTVCSTKTDKNGKTSLNMGLGDMLAWASDKGKFGYVKVSSEEATIVLNHKEGDIFSDEINIVPPVENPIPGTATEEEIKLNGIRFAYEDSVRNAAHAESAGKAVLEAFDEYVKDDPMKRKAANTVLASLFPKDIDEVSLDVLTDAVQYDCGADQFVLCPRVSFEMLYPYRKEIREGLAGQLISPEEVFGWVKNNIEVLDQQRNPQKLRIPPIFVWRSRMSDKPSLKIFFVAVCRSLGFPAKLDFATGKAQFLKDGVWVDADFDETETKSPETGKIEFVACGQEPEYFKNFTIAKIENGIANTLDFEYSDPRGEDGSLVTDTGYYMIVTGKRLSDGSVLSRIETFNVDKDRLTKVNVIVRDEDEVPLDVIGRIDVAGLTDKEKFILAIVKKNGEPTIHALRQIEGDADAVILRPGNNAYQSVKEMLETKLGADPNNLPYVVVADSQGNVYYLSQGYNTTLRDAIDRIFPNIK